MKQQIRILGIDDAPFNFDEKYSTIIGVVMRGGEYLECVLRSQVTIDGTEATMICKQMILNSRHRQQLKVIMLDGACLGGFNVVDINELSGINEFTRDYNHKRQTRSTKNKTRVTKKFQGLERQMVTFTKRKTA